MAPKVSVTLHRNGVTCVVAALGDRTGNFLLRKAMRTFDDGDPVALSTPDGRMVDLEATLDEIILMSTDLNVLFAGEGIEQEEVPEPSRNRTGGGGGGRSSSSTPSSSGTFYLAVANLRVRDNCDKNAEIISDIPKTDIFEVLEEQGDWFRIRLEGFNSAWILSRNKARSLVEKTEPPSGSSSFAATEPEPTVVKKATPKTTKPKPTAAAPSSSNGTFYKSLANMNVREDADGSSDSVADIRKNDVIKVLEIRNDWFRISLRGRDDVWIKSKTKIKSLVEELDSMHGNEKWLQQESNAPSLDGDDEEKKKKEEKMKEEETKKTAAEKAAAAATAKSKPSSNGGGGGSTMVDGAFYSARVSCRIRSIGEGDGDIIADLERGQFAKVIEEKGDWVRIERNDPDGCSIPAWILRRNKRAELLIPAVDNNDAGIRWLEQEKARLECFQPTQEEEKKDEPVSSKPSGGFGGNKKTDEEPQEFDLPPPPPKKKLAPPAAAAPKAATGPSKVAVSGDVYWTCLAAGRCRDEPNSSGEVLGELSKTDAVKMLATQGDWIQIANVWSDKGGDAWLMYQNKKGKQLAEQASDQNDAAEKWSQQKQAIKAAIAAAENGEEPPPMSGGGGGFSGGGGLESGGFGKKEVSDEEAELLAMLKGFGSNTFADGEGGAPPNDTTPAPAAAKPKPAAKVPKPAAKPKPKPAATTPPAPKPKAAPQSSGPVSFDVQKAVAGEFWEALASARVRDENSSSGEVVGELKKTDIVNCIKKDGDWIQIQNVWDGKPNAWLMYQNKKGKQMAQPSSDQGSAGTLWTEQQQAIKAAIAAAENGEEPPPMSSGGGGLESGGFGKKEVSDEEAELLAMLKGFGSNTFADGEGGAPPNDTTPAPAAAKPKPAAKVPKPVAKPKPAADAGGPPPGGDDEAELLAMLKGLSSGGAGAVGNGDDGGFGGASSEPKEDNRTLDEKLDDSDWKVRKTAYTDLSKLFEDAKDGSDDIFLNRNEVIENIAKEKNANAFVSGIDVLFHYFNKYEQSGELSEVVGTEVIRQGFKQAKVKVIESCRKVLVQCLYSSYKPFEFIEVIFNGLLIDGPKHSVESCKTLTDCIKQFGPFVLPLKKIAGKCIELLDKPDKKLQEATQKLLLELVKWMGQPCLEFAINKLNDKDKAALIKKLEDLNIKTSDMKPILTLRNPSKKKVNYEFDEEFNLIIDLIEPVDLLLNLKKTDYSTKVKSSKWNEKVEAYGMIVVGCGSPPKLLPGDISSIIETLREGMNDKMVAVAIAAVNTLGVVADGMGSDFKSYGKSLAQDFIGRMKEKKLVEPGISSMSKFYGRSLTIHDVFNSIHNSVFPLKGKVVPPHTMIGVLQFLTININKYNIPLSNTEIDEINALGYDIIVKVSDPKVKSAGVEMMIAMLLREKTENNKKTPVAKCLAPLADSKDSGQRMVFKKINDAADPEAAAKTTDGKKPAAKGDKKEKKEKKDDKKDSDKKKASSGGGGGGGDDGVTTKLDMSDDDALNLLEKVPVSDLDTLVKTLGGTDWAERKAACESLGSANYQGKVHIYSPAVVTIFQSKTKKFTDKNANVMKGVFIGIEAMAKQSTAESGFDKGSANVMIAIGVEKLQDKKIATVIRPMLMSLAESISPSFVLKGAIKNLSLIKSPIAHQEFSLWMIDMVNDFGIVACGEKQVAEYGMHEFEKARVELKDVKTKTNVLAVLASCYKQKGPNFVKKYLKNMDKNLTGPAEAEFEKIGFDPKLAGASITKKALDVEDSDNAGGGGSEERSDLSKNLDKDVLDKLGNADNKKWKDRKEAMDKCLAACSGEAFIVNGFIKDLAKALSKCLSDLQMNNKPLAANAIGELMTALPSGEKDVILKSIIKPLMLACADGKETMREATINAIDKACVCEEQADQKCLVVVMNGFAGKESGLVKTVARGVLLTWAVKRFPSLKIGTDMKPIIPQILDCMNDKDSKVRSNADAVVGLMISKKGASESDFLKSMDKLSASAQRSTKERLQTIFESTEIETASSSFTSSPAAAQEQEEEPHSAGTGGSEFGLLPNHQKDKREADSWKVRWPSPPAEDLPGLKDSESLKLEWEKYIAKDKLMLFFPKKIGSMDCGNGGLEIIYEVIQNGNDDLFIDHLDLIFKWFTLRLSEREMMPTLVRLLEVLTLCFENLHARGYELKEFEGLILIPYVLEKSGSNKERICLSFKHLIELISNLFPHKKYGQLLIKSLKTKNAKTQANCLLEIARMVENNGIELIGNKGYKDIVKLIDSKDKDVRNAALDCMVSASVHFNNSNDLYQYVGEISSKSKDLTEARIKVSGKVPSASSRSASPGHNPLNNAPESSVPKAGVKERGLSPARPSPIAEEEVRSPPISEAVSTASFGDEILTRLDSLLTAQQPLDKNSDIYLEGKDVIKVVHSLASGAEPTQFAFNRSTLVSHANSVITKLSACLNLSFICAEAQGENDHDINNTGAGGIDVQLLSVCLAALMALFRLPELCREVKPPPLRDMLSTTCSRLLDDRLAATRGPYAATAAQVIKALNKISIQSAIQAPRSASLSALLYLLAHPVKPSPQSSPKFATKITTIFSKLFNRILTEEIENVTGAPFSGVDLPTIMYALNDFFGVYSKREKGNETQYDAAVSLLKRLVLHIGREQIMNIITNNLGPQGKPLLNTIQKEVPAEGRHRQTSQETLERQQSVSGSDFGSDSTKQERLAQLKMKLRNSQDDTF